jgi:hypothetical protein
MDDVPCPESKSRDLSVDGRCLKERYVKHETLKVGFACCGVDLFTSDHLSDPQFTSEPNKQLGCLVQVRPFIDIGPVQDVSLNSQHNSCVGEILVSLPTQFLDQNVFGSWNDRF